MSSGTWFAAPEFSVDPKERCYPIVGCVAYRGYFVERRARAFGERLRGKGLDVTVEGVAAYSTLGHFDDPILNTMIGWNDVELASIIFHELTHQMIYVPSDADFDEALAVTVEEEGVRRWLKSQGREKDLEQYDLQQQRFLQVLATPEPHARRAPRAVRLGGHARAHARAQGRRIRSAARIAMHRW